MPLDSKANSYRLSPTQRGALIQSLLDEHPSTTVDQVVCELSEDLDPAALERVWQLAVAQFPSLRVRFSWEGLAEPVQEVVETVHPAFVHHDWRNLPIAEQEERFKAFLDGDRLAGLDKREAPLMRFNLFRFGESRYRLVWTYSMLVADRYAVASLLKEVFRAYDAVRAGAEWRFSDFSDFRLFVDWLQTRDSVADERYWRGVLAGFTRPLRLEIGRPRQLRRDRPAMREERAASLSAAETVALQRFAEENGVSMSVLIQCAWALLLHRYTGERDVVFGIVRGGRHGGLPEADRMLGVCINNLPMRVQVDPDARLRPWLQSIVAQSKAARAHEWAALMDIQRWSEMLPGTPLFETVVICDRAHLDTILHAQDGAWASRQFRPIYNSGYPITLYAYAETRMRFTLAYDADRFEADAVSAMLGHLRVLLLGMVADPDATLGRLPLLTEAERRQVLVDWNDTAIDYPAAELVHEAVERQARRSPDATALIFRNQRLSYRELNAKANRLAHYLLARGVRPGTLVGVYLDRSPDLLIAVLAVLKAGGAYVPMDPVFPEKRIAYLLDDSRVGVVVTHSAYRQNLDGRQALVVMVDGDGPAIGREIDLDPGLRAVSSDLAYVLYTSGSTGNPKGTMVEHRNVVNFFAAMDRRIGAEPGVWLAVTSLSFDISVLELLWTLTHGSSIVLYGGDDRVASDAGRPAAVAKRPIEFSLFYFASDEGERASDKYRLLLEGAKFADRHGFTAVWTPERHFHAFGGLYPNPAVASAAIAAVTKNVKLRAGSCVLPLHHPIRVAEDWSLVDNLSEGRVGVSVASGWQPNDFVIAPKSFADRKAIMFRDIETIRRLWRGESLAFPGPKGTPVEVRLMPRPIQPELPIWVTAAAHPDTFRQAGEIGAYVLTHLLGQSVDEVAEKIGIYRKAWRESGHPGDGHVTLMLHTFVGVDAARVRSIVREPMKAYLGSSVDLIKAAAWNAPIFRARSNETGKSPGEMFEGNALSPADMEALTEHAFERYYETSGLFGTPESCAVIVERLRDNGVDEIACLVDFGVDSEAVLESLPHLLALKERAERVAAPTDADYGLFALLRDHPITHLQCTPSMARMLMLEPAVSDSLKRLRAMLVGGEAFPPALRDELRGLVGGKLFNMYGPTETTIWSTVHEIDGDDDVVPIGRPIANTQVHVLDELYRPVPIGVPGELYIGGAGVARGYLDRAELTASRFVTLAIDGSAEARFYRTGDRVYYRPDGTLVFLGRADFQVKLRGFRIELGEVEAALGHHPAVREAVAAVKADTAGEHHLVAYVVFEGEGDALTGDLRRHLEERLPNYMVPTVFVPMTTLPLTPNGKIDRRALPELVDAMRGGDRSLDPPRTPVEVEVARILCDVLGREQVGRNESFFNLGGHSLSAVQVAYRIRRHFNVDFPLQTLLQAPTVAELAVRVEDALIAQADSDQLAALLDEIDPAVAVASSDSAAPSAAAAQ